MPATLDMNTHTNLHDAEPAEKPPGKLRFTYASGSRPLDGYTIKRGVGRGGFGEVYYAVSDAGKDVALKLIRRNLEVELRGVTHCLNLKHHNLIDIYDIRTDANDDRWVVMEYVSGASLDAVIDRHPQGMPVDMAVHWFRGICAGVAYLHDHGIVHRDLKPANIFIDDGHVKIGDYGLSKFISCSRRSGQTESVGTVHYMAPEIANGRYGREIDAYAVGIILFEMLTGHVPFEGESVGEVLMKHLTAEPDLTQLNEPFLGIVASAMAKDPELRTQDVADMLRRIDAYFGRGDASEAVAATTAAYVGALGGAAPAAAAAAGADAAATARRPYNSPAPSPTPSAGAVPPFGTGPGPAPRGPAPPPEPIAEFVKQTWREFADSIRFRYWPAPVRIAAVVFGVIFVMRLFKANELIWIALPFWFAYMIYRTVRARAILKEASSSRSYGTPTEPRPPGDRHLATTPARPAPSAVKAQFASSPADAPWYRGATPPWRRRQQSWQSAVRQHLRTISRHDRLSSLLGSLLIAALVGSIAALVAAVFALPRFSFETYLWIAIVTVGGSWGVMIPAKLAEGHVEDQAPLRFSLLLAGALVGATAWLAADFLMLKLPASTDFAPGPWDTLTGGSSNSVLSQQVRSGQGVDLSLQMHAAYFGCLLLALRWWKMAEWSRPARVSVWSIAVAVAAAWLMSLVWWYPQPIGVLAAAAIAFTVQLSSPWLTPEQRVEIAEKAVA
ncbi:MAG: serine/threonine protein kinase [Pirellulales bacterium]|nr:serine/threonine protein kinase [Pirellulales bacterium]